MRDSGQRTFRNPKTGDMITRDKNVRLSFRPSVTLKKTLNEKFGEAVKKK